MLLWTIYEIQRIFIWNKFLLFQAQKKLQKRKLSRHVIPVYVVSLYELQLSYSVHTLKCTILAHNYFHGSDNLLCYRRRHGGCIAGCMAVYTKMINKMLKTKHRENHITLTVWCSQTFLLNCTICLKDVLLAIFIVLLYLSRRIWEL
jgi:hypothetical protein